MKCMQKSTHTSSLCIKKLERLCYLGNEIQGSDQPTRLLSFFLVCVEAERSNQKIFSHVGTESPLPGYYQYFLGVKCLAQGHNMAEVGFQPLTSRSGV